jgi:hypothetical protein
MQSQARDLRKVRIMKLDKPSETMVPLLVGALSAAYMQSRTGWWLNSGTGVAFTVGVLFLLGAFFASWTAGSPRARAIALWVGSMTGLAASLFWMGPGTIWPIVLIVSSIISACTVMAGSGVGRLCCSTFASSRSIRFRRE